MSTQIFKQNVPSDLLFSLLDKLCLKNENQYIFNNVSFKKGMYDDSILSFVEECKPYYHNSKKHYVERKMSYRNFTSILRQICNSNQITYTSQIKYDSSTYDIIYYIGEPRFP